MIDCERCGKEMGFEATIGQLAGAVPALLCCACGREFGELITNSDEWRALGEHKALRLHYQSLASAQQPVSEEAWMAFAARDLEIEISLIAFANRFLATVPAKIEN